MENKTLARGIAALFALQDVDNWSSTDVALNKAAISLWKAADCHRWEFAAMLLQEGVDVDSAIALCDVPNYELSLVQMRAGVQADVKAMRQAADVFNRLMNGTDF